MYYTHRQHGADTDDGHIKPQCKGSQFPGVVRQTIQAYLGLSLRKSSIHRRTCQGIMIMASSSRAPVPFVVARLE